MTHIRQRRDSATNWTTGDPVLQLGEVGWETDTRKAKIGDGTTAWTGLAYIVEEGVTSVNGMDGDVTLVKSDIGLGNVDNTPDTAKPISTSQQAALDDKADLDSPVFIGNPTAPTPSAGDADTSIATTSFVDIALADFAGATVTMTNKDLTDPSNEFPETVVNVIDWDITTSDSFPIDTPTNYLNVDFDEVTGARYRVIAYVEASNDAGEFTTLTINEDDIGGGDLSQVAECIKDHRVTGRREGIACIGIFTGFNDGPRRVQLVVDGSGGGSTFHATNSSSLLTVERMS